MYIAARQNSVMNKKIRQFPYEHESRKEIHFYPQRVEKIPTDILEIGPGRGDFLLGTAARLPNKRLTAIELGKKRHFKMIPRIEKKGLSNITLIQGDARIILPQFINKESVKRAYVLFPDPWPKNRHSYLRLMSIDFINLLINVLEPGGHLFCATDYWPYAEWVVSNVLKIDRLEIEGRPFFTNIDGIDYYQPSFFEKKWRDEGRAIYYMRFLKKSR